MELERKMPEIQIDPATANYNWGGSQPPTAPNSMPGSVKNQNSVIF
jgi:hypothetical protein